MSKTTKIIAALGVVAGLGVAALPAFTFAEGEPSVTGDVEVLVQVDPAIAMTITGNNDDGTVLGGTFEEVEDPTGDPSTSGYLELSGGHYTKSTDTTVDDSKTYYIFTANVQADYDSVDNFDPDGIASTAQVTNYVDYHPIPQTAILGTSSTYARLLPNSTLFGDVSAAASSQNHFGSVVTVYTNNTSGYHLAVKDKDAVTDLTHIAGESYIPTTSSEVAAGVAGWNYDVTTTDSTPVVTEHSAITAADVTIDSLNTKTDHGRITYVDYNVATAGDQATGLYTDTIVYTATCN